MSAATATTTTTPSGRFTTSPSTASVRAAPTAPGTTICIRSRASTSTRVASSSWAGWTATSSPSARCANPAPGKVRSSGCAFIRASSDAGSAGDPFRLENRARELGYETLHLDTTVGQTAAQALYRCHGYMETRRTQLGPFEVIPFAKSIRPRSSSHAAPAFRAATRCRFAETRERSPRSVAPASARRGAARQGTHP